MKIKRFTCRRCGAPKVNNYTSPYIMCDYCGNFTDIDYTMGLDSWNKDQKRTDAYNHRKAKFESDLAGLLKKRDEKAYYEMQFDYWDMYYKAFPEYLPPSIQGGEVYNHYVEIAARSTTEYYFDKVDPSLKKMEVNYTTLQQKLKYIQKGHLTILEGEGFFHFMNAFLDYLNASFKDFYENPSYTLFHDVLPPDVHLKMKMSTFAQGWLPYLKKEDGEKMLLQLHFTNEYQEMKPIDGEEISCENCKKPVFAPAGSFKVHCENCHTNTSVKTQFNCVSCGAANTVPENPAKEIACISCKTVNRLLQPLFG
jgi:LSD1 subclass zinc finger protein